jgi:outer membrane lipoprotein SlyB
MSQVKEVKPPNMLVGVFSTLADAESAVQGLEKAGLTTSEITVISSNDVVKQYFQQYKPDVDAEDWKGAAMLGGSAGALFGGLAAATAVVTGAGIPLVAAGGLAGFLTGGIVGSLAGAMTERGFETEAADYYELAVSDGKTLVAVDLTSHPDADSTRAAILRVLESAGAEPVELSKNPDLSS